MATYYIDGATGNDSDSGLTTDLAWATIGKANSTLTAGDTVEIRAGTYTETILPANSGTAGNYITYKNYGSETATIDKSAGGDCATLTNRSYICIDGLYLTGDATYTHTGRWLTIQNASSQDNYNIIQNCTCTHALQWGGISLKYSNHNQILDNHLEDAGGDVIEIFPGSYNIIDGNTIIGGDVQEIPGYDHSCFCIRGNTTTWSEYNEVRNNLMYDGHDDIAGILLETRYNLFEKNIFRDTRSSAGACFKFAGGNNNTVRLNIMWGGGVGFMIYTNVWSGRAVPATSNYIYNNIMFQNTTGSGDYAGGVVLTAYEGADVIQYNEIKNNIIVGNSPRQVSIMAAEAEQSKILDNEINNNIIYGTAASQNTVRRWSTNYTTANADSSLDEFSGNIDDDPEFINASGTYALATDFKINSSSPAYNAGVNVGLTADYFDGAVPQEGGYDIGIHEFSQGASTTIASLTHRRFTG